MPVVSRRLVLMLPALLASRAARATDAAAAPAVIQQFYADLLTVMKVGKRVAFNQRYAQMAPAITRTFDLGLMSRLSVGPGWTALTPDQQRRLTDAFARYTISVWTERFDEFSGERFEVEPNAVSNASGVVVQSRLLKKDGEKVTLNYLMRPGATGQWQAIDVYLSGTISELATKRSEFGSVLQSSGAEGLLRVLEQKTAAAGGG